MTPIQKAVFIVGGQSALARKLKKTPQAIQKWCSKNHVPASQVIPVESAVDGAVTRHELRPDLYPL